MRAEEQTHPSVTALASQYVFSVGVDTPLEMYNGTTFFLYHRDALGSITSITDYSGTVDGSYVYDAWGNLLQSADTMSNPIRFQGGLWDALLGLLFDGNGYYEPSTGRYFGTATWGRVPGRSLTAFEGDNAVSWSPYGPTGFMSVQYEATMPARVGEGSGTLGWCTKYCGHGGTAGWGDGGDAASSPSSPATKTFHANVFYAMVALVAVCLLVGAIFIGAALSAYFSLTAEGDMTATAVAIGEGAMDAALGWGVFFTVLAISALFCAGIVLLMEPQIYS